MDIPPEIIIGVPIAAAGLYLVRRKTHKPSLIIKKAAYDRKTNKIVIHIENKKPICYSLKAAIKLPPITPNINVPDYMSPARATTNGSNTLIAEDNYPIIIGPNEIIEITYDLIVPQEFLLDHNLNDLDVNIKFSKYEDVKNEVTKEIFEGKLKEKLDKIKPKRFGIIIKKCRCGKSLKQKEKPKLLPFDQPPHVSFGVLLHTKSIGRRIGLNTMMLFIELRRLKNKWKIE